MTKSPSSGNFSSRLTSEHPPRPSIDTRERVRYSDTDRMGIAHNKNYLEWFEIGRTEYCRLKGISYKEIEERGFYMVVAEASCRYKKPLHYDEEFIIRVSLREASPKKIVFGYELLKVADEQLIASGYTVHITTNARAEVCSLPEDILNMLFGAEEEEL